MTATALAGHRLAAPTLSELVVERVHLHARLAASEGSALAADLAAVDRQLAGPAGAPLVRLGDLFRLSAVDRDTLQACIAASIDLGLGEALARLTGRPYVTGAAVSALFGHPRGRVWNPGGSLAIWELVRADAVGPGEPEALAVDPVVPAWLGGELWVDRSLAGVVRLITGGVRLSSWPVEATAAAVQRSLARGTPIRYVLSGEPGSGRTLCAAAIAAAASLPPLVVDTTDLAEQDWPSAYVRLQRLAAIGGLALVWTGAHVGRAWPALVSPAPVHFLAVEPGVGVRSHPGLVSERIELPEATIAERRWAWTQAVPDAATWPAAEVEELARRYRIGVGEIAAIAAAEPPTPAAAAAAARTARRALADEVAQPMPCPYGWDDLVLPPALKTALEELAFEAAEREAVQEATAGSRLLPREPGLVALFSGPSGTGKTMAAQVLAAHLELDLLRVDLAAVISKYIGETAKNLNRIFALARHRQAILLFDEADAHFTRRTDVKDAHDRYANADTNHLLQLIEAHRGVVILATNRRSDMDSAFVRRLRHVLDFPRPEAPERLALWRQALAAAAPRQWSGLSKRIGRVAEAVDVTGAQIKSAALTALFIARREKAPLSFAHVVRGLDRELAKEGRPLSASDRQRWSHA